MPEARPDLGPCWLWTGATSRGYGVLAVGPGERRLVKAHRVAYEEAHGPMPAGLEPDHLCRVKSCVRPSHMEAVTHAENMRRAGLSGVAATNAAKVGCRACGEEYDMRDTSGRRCGRCRRTWNRDRMRARRAKQGEG